MATEQSHAVFGLAEHELRSELEDELVRAMRAEGQAPTLHAIARSVARILELDHQRMAAQRVTAAGEAGVEHRMKELLALDGE